MSSSTAADGHSSSGNKSPLCQRSCLRASERKCQAKKRSGRRQQSLTRVRRHRLVAVHTPFLFSCIPCHHSCNLGGTGSSGRCGLSSTVRGATPCALLDVAKRLVYYFEMLLCDRVLAACRYLRHQYFLLPGGCAPPCISLYGRRSRADFFGFFEPRSFLRHGYSG